MAGSIDAPGTDHRNRFGMVFRRFDRFFCRWKGPHQPIIIGLSFQVGGCVWRWSEDAIVDRQPNEHNAIADAIERSPPETTDCVEHRVRDFADDLRWL
jgi:hypothetical protein